MKKTFLLIILITVLGFTATLAQTLTVGTYGVSPRDVERDTIAQYFDRAYNGLLNVGTETQMYLKGEFVGSSFTNPVWTVVQEPAAGNGVLGAEADSVDYVLIKFTPMATGVYAIELSDGTAKDTLFINASTYVGTEQPGLSCITCHNNAVWDFKYDKWQETGHATMLFRGLEGTLSSHYSEGCISCHTTGYDPDAANNGFDDFPFNFPDSLYPGVYAATVAAYPEAMARANIQCESCHGPGTAHFSDPYNKSKRSADIATDNCAWCHDDGTHHAYPEQWDHSGDDATEFDGRGFDGGHAKGTFMGYAGGRSGCNICHSGAAFVAWAKNGKVEASPIPTPTVITCATCHDPHDATNIHQLRILEVELGNGTVVTYDQYGTGVLCMNCHKSRVDAATYAEDPDNASSHFGAHHGPEADLLLGTNTPNFLDKDGKIIKFPSSPHAVAVLPGQDKGNACVNCHMAGDNQVADAEGNIILVGGHSWNMNDAEGNDNIAACAPCHGNIGTSFKDKKYYVNGNADLDENGTAEGLQLEIHGLLEKLALFLPPVGEPTVELVSGDTTLTSSIMKSAYVYFWIEEDRSFGIHNPAFAFGLLKAAIEEVGGAVSVDFPENEGMPQEYQLSQNYPNPFNPSTTIEYSLPEQSNVTITIYDVLGNELDVLFSGEMAAGVHRLTWNASNYASGIYIYKMSSANFVQVKKMLLLK